MLFTYKLQIMTNDYGSEEQNRFETVLEQADAGRGEYFGQTDLDNAKYLINEVGNDVDVRYYHNRGIEVPELGVDYPNYESVELGSGTAALMLEIAVSYPHEFKPEDRRLDFQYVAEDNLNNGDRLMTDRGEEGSETDINLAVEGQEEDELRYTIDVPLASKAKLRQEDGSLEPQIESRIVMEGEI